MFAERFQACTDCSFLVLLEGHDEIRNVDFKDLKTACM